MSCYITLSLTVERYISVVHPLLRYFFHLCIQFVCAKFSPQKFLAHPRNIGISSPLLFVSSPDPILAMCHCEEPLEYLVRKVTV